ncbi:hypothetical protein [Novosphingobium sp.]|uniref:hypothetical protein n=1 Tax=Novosphingobium sp. TaxID=1874826 RepID=UPI0025CE0CE9|nr:hypothetical protein [Novosphingobium sp.]
MRPALQPRLDQRQRACQLSQLRNVLRQIAPQGSFAGLQNGNAGFAIDDMLCLEPARFGQLTQLCCLIGGNRGCVTLAGPRQIQLRGKICFSANALFA